MLDTTKETCVRGDASLNLSCPGCGALPMPYSKRYSYFIDHCVECRFV
jgi:hypothetical protein